jgi:hypothetical protein
LLPSVTDANPLDQANRQRAGTNLTLYGESIDAVAFDRAEAGRGLGQLTGKNIPPHLPVRDDINAATCCR